MALGETTTDASLAAMSAAEAQGYADESWGTRWVPVAKAIRYIENGGSRQQAPPQTVQTPQHTPPASNPDPQPEQQPQQQPVQQPQQTPRPEPERKRRRAATGR